MEALHQLGQRQTHIRKCLRPAVERGQAIHQHNLAVEMLEIMLIETFDHMVTIVLIAIAQHAENTAFCRFGQPGRIRHQVGNKRKKL